MALVVQTPTLFRGTVEENITYGATDGKDGASTTVSRNAFEKAAKTACVDDFVNVLPDGYATQVGNQGQVRSSAIGTQQSHYYEYI